MIDVMKIFLGILGVIGLLFIGGIAYGRAGNSVSTNGPDQFEAQATCQKLVREALRSPANATFSNGLETRTTNIAGNKWSVRGWVDAQNGFGAQIRNDYDCQVTYTGSRWQQDVLNITAR